jgi:hypothetical protein
VLISHQLSILLRLSSAKDVDEGLHARLVLDRLKCHCHGKYIFTRMPGLSEKKITF